MSSSEDSHSSSVSLDSALYGEGSRRSTHSPSPETIGAVLDDYVGASKDGRAAFASGDIPAAVSQFDQALDIELQTEMKCLYDTSIGMVSGLVRKEVDSRLQSKATDTPFYCDKILWELNNVYKQACRSVAALPNDPSGYLRMGSTLCIVNQWEKAKLIYKEGINMCKVKSALKAALKQLIKMELMLGGVEIPRDDWKPRLGSPNSPSSPHRQKAKTFSATGKLRPHSELVSPQGNRSELLARSLELASSRTNGVGNRNRAESISLPPNSPKLKNGNSPSPLRKKKFSLNSIKILKNNEPIPTLTFDETNSWAESFSPYSTVAGGNNELRPSAIAHMRRLSLEEMSAKVLPVIGESDDSDTNQRIAFKASEFTSLKIESDDSELEDN